MNDAQPVGRIEILGIADWDGASLPGFRLDGMNLQVFFIPLKKSEGCLVNRC